MLRPQFVFTASQSLPFVEAAAKAKLAGSFETHSGDHLAAVHTSFCLKKFPWSDAYVLDLVRQAILLLIQRVAFMPGLRFARPQNRRQQIILNTTEMDELVM